MLVARTQTFDQRTAILSGLLWRNRLVSVLRLAVPALGVAAFLVLMARLAHFIPGVVLGTVAEYEPGKKLSTRTAGIRVATTYGSLMILGLAAGSPGSRSSMRRRAQTPARSR